MAEKFRSFLRFLDVPSGSVLGVFSGAIISLSIWATLTGHDLPGGVVTAYLGCVGAKTGYGIMTRGSNNNGKEGKQGDSESYKEPPDVLVG